MTGDMTDTLTEAGLRFRAGKILRWTVRIYRGVRGRDRMMSGVEGALVRRDDVSFFDSDLLLVAQGYHRLRMSSFVNSSIPQSVW